MELAVTCETFSCGFNNSQNKSSYPPHNEIRWMLSSGQLATTDFQLLVETLET